MQPTKPKVLHLFNSFNHGGTERQTLQLVQLLQESGHYDIFIACQSSKGILRSQVESLGFRNVPSFPLNCLYDLNALKQLIRFAAHLKRLSIHILHTHDFYTNVFGLAAGVIAGVPVRIASRRELDVFSPLQRRVEHQAFRVAHSVMANCEFLRNQLIKEGVPPQRTLTIYNGVHPDRVRTNPGLSREQMLNLFGLPSGVHLITMVANLYNLKKDHETFLHAARQVAKEFTQAAFVLAGDGEPGPLRALSAQLGIADRTFLIGRCDHLAELLAVSDIGVLSSISEGLSNSIIEYMAAGLPVVASDVGGTCEAVLDGETGFVVQPRSIDAMAERIIALLYDPERARMMGLRAQRRATEQFSPASQLERTHTLYEHLLWSGSHQQR